MGVGLLLRPRIKSDITLYFLAGDGLRFKKSISASLRKQFLRKQYPIISVAYYNL